MGKPASVFGNRPGCAPCEARSKQTTPGIHAEGRIALALTQIRLPRLGLRLQGAADCGDVAVDQPLAMWALHKVCLNKPQSSTTCRTDHRGLSSAENKPWFSLMCGRQGLYCAIPVFSRLIFLSWHHPPTQTLASRAGQVRSLAGEGTGGPGGVRQPSREVLQSHPVAKERKPTGGLTRLPRKGKWVGGLTRQP